jgi:peptidoglycan/xylan/chitin deacetylase (PgdA/CDA1 family)
MNKLNVKNNKFSKKLITKILSMPKALDIILRLSCKYSLIKNVKKQTKLKIYKKKNDQNFFIIMFHRINDDKNPYFYGTPLQIFEEQIKIMKKFYNIFSLDEIIQLSKKSSIPERAITITFDDGYLDNYTNAFPILKKYKIPATIFLATGVINSNQILWHDHVIEVFRESTEDSFILDGNIYSLKGTQNRVHSAQLILNKLKKLQPKIRDRKISELENKLKIQKRKFKRLMLNWEEIKEMSNNQISFGAHTRSHIILTQIPLLNAAEEINKSKEIIEKMLKKKVDLFAYPNGKEGDFNEPIKRILKEIGFKGAVTTKWGGNNQFSDLYDLNRVQLWDNITYLSFIRLGFENFKN